MGRRVRPCPTASHSPGRGGSKAQSHCPELLGEGKGSPRRQPRALPWPHTAPTAPHRYLSSSASCCPVLLSRRLTDQTSASRREAKSPRHTRRRENVAPYSRAAGKRQEGCPPEVLVWPYCACAHRGQGGVVSPPGGGAGHPSRVGGGKRAVPSGLPEGVVCPPGDPTRVCRGPTGLRACLSDRNYGAWC